jgi:hypothetical protein
VCPSNSYGNGTVALRVCYVASIAWLFTYVFSGQAVQKQYILDCMTLKMETTGCPETLVILECLFLEDGTDRLVAKHR